ncbi:MAG TPA: hypothetical protein VGP43_11495 [Chitinophagaceae bacterium]|nr:hypothetical protein [Chitinophagaceae bacterium]
MLFWNKICGFIAIFFLCGLSSSAQTANYINPTGNTISQKYLPGQVNNPINKGINASYPIAIIPQNYYTQHFGVMCKKELALEKATKIPFRFRLGSLQQCNYLEGKR